MFQIQKYIMGFSMCVLPKLILLLVYVGVANSLSPLHSYSCHDEERSALLQFKESLIINKSASVLGAYPKVSSWKPEEDRKKNCCSWDGVECDEETGYVIGLDLSSSCLYGSINSSSSLFSLVHLQRLNLANNNFSYSQIPPTIRNFPMLRNVAGLMLLQLDGLMQTCVVGTCWLAAVLLGVESGTMKI